MPDVSLAEIAVLAAAAAVNALLVAASILMVHAERCEPEMLRNRRVDI